MFIITTYTNGKPNTFAKNTANEILQIIDNTLNGKYPEIRNNAEHFLKKSKPENAVQINDRFRLYNIEEKHRDICTEKKNNVRYWDGLEAEIEELIKTFVSASLTTTCLIDPDDPDNMDEAICEAYAHGIIPEIRDKIVEFIENHNGYFPSINEDF